MEYKEIVPDVIEAVNYIPRNYVIAWLNPGAKTGTGNKIAFGPAYEMKAGVLGSFWPVYARRLGWWADYRKNHESSIKLPEDLVDGLASAKDLPERFREAVKKKEGTYVTDVTPGEAVRNIRRLGNLVSGEVKSKSAEGYYDVSVWNIFLTPKGDMNIVAIDCGCKEHKETMSKRQDRVTFVCDTHPTALINRFVSHRLNPTHLREPPKAKTSYKGREKEEADNFYKLPEFFHPFNFVANWSGERGRLRPKSEELASLEIDMAIAYYFGGETYDEINRKVFTRPDIYPDPIKNAYVKGELRFELLRHGSERREEKDRNLVDAEKYVLSQICHLIMPVGYSYEGNCLEMGRPAIRFESKDNVLDFVPGREHNGKYRPAFYVTKPKPEANMTVEDMCKADAGMPNPFRNLNIVHDLLDDSTKQAVPSVIRAATTLILPERPGTAEISVHEEYEQLCRRTISRYSPDKERDLKKARLLYERRQ